ncbi:hypothetical protein [Sorangium sp. So ce131]|uniref:hypothetical protein n=1 Tax=Sorangium sp. So ce131 TaxID=3133282 RepID=UPI003F5F2471
MTYPPPAASAPLELGFAALALLVAALFVWGAARGSAAAGAAPSRRAAAAAAAGVALWMGATWALAASGTLARFDLRPPPMALMFAVVMAGGLSLGLSPLGRRFALGLPLAALVGAQAFRFPLELLMHRAAAEGVMPAEMSYSGLNLDILTGASALVLAPLIALRRVPLWVAAAWNALGIVLLSVIAAVAVLSSPMVRAFGDDPGHVNTWVCYPPFVWLPAVMVMAALFGHVVVARRLRAERRDGERSDGAAAPGPR